MSFKLVLGLRKFSYTNFISKNSYEFTPFFLSYREYDLFNWGENVSILCPKGTLTKKNNNNKIPLRVYLLEDPQFLKDSLVTLNFTSSVTIR